MERTDELRAWEYDVVLSDGGTVHVRPITPDDAKRLIAFHAGLSPQSQYYRFFSPKPRLTDKEVEKFTNVDMVDRAALVAVLGDEIIGVGRYDRWPGRDEAEVAFTVADQHQGRGISTVLLEHLSAVARSRGIHRFTAEVLPDNRGMLTVFRRAGFEVHNEFAGGIVDVSFDIDPTPAFLETVERREQRAESRSIARLLRSRSVAVVGASDRLGSVGRAVFRNLLANGFDGPVYPVNPTTAHVASVPAYDLVSEIPDDVHLAVIAVPSADVPAVVEDCARKRVRAVVVISTGFSDAGPDGSDAERRLVELARGNGMRLLGPASMGLVAHDGGSRLFASFTSAPVRQGNVAVSLQSGPLGTAMLEHIHKLGLGISSFVSLGNKADVSANDLLNYWETEPDTAVITMYTESFGNPRKFGRIARRVSRSKPIVVVKAGRGGRDDMAVDALYQQAGVIRVDSVRQLFDAARVLATQPLPGGPRVSVLSNALSPARLALDHLANVGLVPASLGYDTRAELGHLLPQQARIESAIDLTYRATPADYRHAMQVLLADPAVDAMVVIYAPPVVDALDEVGVAIAETAAAHHKTVVAVALGHEDGELRPGCPVPTFAFPESATEALGRVWRYAAWRHRPAGEVRVIEGLGVDEVADAIAHALELRPNGTLLPVPVANRVLAAYGVPYGESRAVTTLEAALAGADEIGYPVTLKAAGLERLARSESGGVALDLQGPDQLRGSWQRMRANLGTGMAEAIVQRMMPAGVETIVAVQADPTFGPVISFGLGGAFADVIADRATRSLPLTDVDARDLIASSRAAGALDKTTSAVAALEDLLHRVAALADDHPEIVSLVLNPVLCSAEGAFAVDAKIRVAPVAPSPYDVPIRRLG